MQPWGHPLHSSLPLDVPTLAMYTKLCSVEVTRMVNQLCENDNLYERLNVICHSIQSCCLGCKQNLAHIDTMNIDLMISNILTTAIL